MNIEKINNISSINHEIIRYWPEPPSAGHNLHAVWFQSFTILNKVDRLTSTTGKAQFVLNK